MKKEITTYEKTRNLKQEISEEFADFSVSKEEQKEKFENIANLFQLFRSVYGEIFNKQYADEKTMDTWVIILWKYNTKQLSKAFHYSIQKYKNYPPNLAQFKEICDDLENIKNNEIENIDKIYQKIDTEGLKK